MTRRFHVAELEYYRSLATAATASLLSTNLSLAHVAIREITEIA